MIIMKPSNNKTNNYENPVAKIMFVFGLIVLVSGLVAGLMMLTSHDDTQYYWVVWGASASTGLLFIGLAEIIHLLNTIKNKL